MSIERKESSSTLTDNKSSLVSSPAVNPQQTQKETSSHTQLLRLAKTFALDGAMLPVEKQMPLEDRTLKRERLSKLRKQQNLETIIQQAITYCSDAEATNKADPDWFTHYIKLAEDVTNKTMQDLWAKILAGEITQPGAFSLKALTLLKSMSITEAKLLAKACALAIKDNSKKNIRLFSGSYQKPRLFNIFNKNKAAHINLSHFGLNYTELLSLADNHLIFIQESESKTFKKNEELNFNYNSINFTLKAKKEDVILQFYKFTPMGTELAALISDKPADNNYFNHLKQQLNLHFAIT